MVDDTTLGEKPQYIQRSNSVGGGAVNSRLSLFPSDEEGSYRDPGLRSGQPHEKQYPLVRNDAGGGSERKIDFREDASDGGRLRAGDERDGGDGLRHEAKSLRTLKALDDSQLPDVSDGYWRQALEAASRVAGPRLRDGDGVLTASDALVASTDKAIEVLYEQMHTKRVGDEKEALAVARIENIRQGAARTILNTQTKVDEQLLRRKNESLLPKILARLIELEKEGGLGAYARS